MTDNQGVIYTADNSLTCSISGHDENYSTSIVIPTTFQGRGVNSIGENAFEGCNDLTSITIGNSVTNIGAQAFQGCSNLTDINVLANTPPSITSNTFPDYSVPVYVPVGCVKAYTSHEVWKNFTTITEINGGGGNNNSGTEIQCTDISQLDNVIYIESFEDSPGTTELELSIKMKNSAEIRAFQFDLELPEGVTPFTEDNEMVYWLNGDRAPKKAGGQFYHTIEISVQDDGSYRFLCGAQQDKTFAGNDGEVVVLKVNIADDMKAGDYPITLKDIKLTETDISNSYQTEKVVSKLTIVEYELGDISGDGIVDVSDYIGVANHILGNTPTGFNARAADVNKDNIIDVSDYIGIANIILTGSIYGNNASAAPAVKPITPHQEDMREPQ